MRRQETDDARLRFLLAACKRMIRAQNAANDTSLPLKDGRWSYGPAYLARVGGALEELQEAVGRYDPAAVRREVEAAPGAAV